jgi:3,4-dihydroxy 2-butanone 4-phosphate synthase
MSGNPEARRGDAAAVRDAPSGRAESEPEQDGVPEAVTRAVAAVEAGEPVLVHDATDREGEVDFVRPAAGTTHETVARLRNDAGGLVCVALGHGVSEAFGLPLYADAIDHPAVGGDLEYDDRSSFSVPVNHRNTRTGITDHDRALTIRALADAAVAPDESAFADTFRSPGHVRLLRAASGLSDRRGHTELAVALARAAGREPAMVVCEMLDDAAGGALSPADARRYARRNEVPYVEGRDLVAALG